MTICVISAKWWLSIWSHMLTVVPLRYVTLITWPSHGSHDPKVAHVTDTPCITWLTWSHTRFVMFTFRRRWKKFWTKSASCCPVTYRHRLELQSDSTLSFILEKWAVFFVHIRTLHACTQCLNVVSEYFDAIWKLVQAEIVSYWLMVGSIVMRTW